MKKFQVFVSSTYKDLLAERQAVVEAILMAGQRGGTGGGLRGATGVPPVLCRE
jgi:hypothetical protein